MIKATTSHEAHTELIHWRHSAKPGDSVQVDINDSYHRYQFRRMLFDMKDIEFSGYGNPITVRI